MASRSSCLPTASFQFLFQCKNLLIAQKQICLESSCLIVLPGKACHSCSVCRMARGIVHIILWRICGIVPDAQIHISGGTESEILEKTDFSVYVAECPPSIIFRCSLVQFHDCHRVRHIVLYVRRRMEQRTRILRIIVFSRCIRHI